MYITFSLLEESDMSYHKSVTPSLAVSLQVTLDNLKVIALYVGTYTAHVEYTH